MKKPTDSQDKFKGIIKNLNLQKSRKNPEKPDRIGKNGNPLKTGGTNPNAGRPKKIPALEELFNKHMTEEKDGLEAIDAVILQLRNKAIRGDMKAIEYLLNRVYGKPKESLEVKQETKINSGLTDDERLAMIEKIKQEMNE